MKKTQKEGPFHAGMWFDMIRTSKANDLLQGRMESIRLKGKAPPKLTPEITKRDEASIDRVVRFFVNSVREDRPTSVLECLCSDLKHQLCDAYENESIPEIISEALPQLFRYMQPFHPGQIMPHGIGAICQVFVYGDHEPSIYVLFLIKENGLWHITTLNRIKS